MSRRPLSPAEWLVAILLGLAMASAFAFVAFDVPESPISRCGADCAGSAQ